MSAAGQFRDLITVQTKTDTPDGRGGFARTFADSSVQFFAKIIQRHFTIQLENDKIETGIAFFVTIKEEPPADILESRLKIVSSGRILEIQSDKGTQDLDETEFKCIEVTVAG